MSKKIKSVYGLVGKNISYSFSQDYFTKKFYQENLNTSIYKNFDIDTIDDFPLILNDNIESLKGLNITIPYKEKVFEYLDEIDELALKIGAVNTIKLIENYKLKGYNTDIYGFIESLKPLLKTYHKSALILGTGGAAKAIAFALEQLNISYYFVSRNPKNSKTIAYDELDRERIQNNLLLINCTPLGTYPNINNSPKIPYQFITKNHLFYDLIYNPEETQFLKIAKEKGAIIKNGLEMLILQAEKAWEIWNT